MMTSKYAPTEEEMEFAKASMPVIQQKKSTTSKSKYAATEEELEFAGGALSEPEREEIPWYKSLPNAFIQGLNEGIIGLGGGVQGEVNRILHPEEIEKGNEEIKKYVEEKFPAEEGFSEDVLKRSAKGIPTAITSAGTGGLLPALGYAGASGLSGATAKQLGAGELGQTIAEIAPYAAPSLLKKLVGSNKNQQQLIDFARNAGLSEEQIVPAIKKQNLFTDKISKLAFKGESTQQRLKNSQEALGEIYNTIKNSPEAKKPLDKKFFQTVSNEYSNELKKLPSSLRKVVDENLKTLVKSNKNAEDYIDFYQKANYEASQLGKDAINKIQGLQKITKNTIGKIDPQMGKDFEIINELYTNVKNLSGGLKKPAADWLLYTKGIGAVYGLYSGDYDLMRASLGAIAGRKLATEFLLNPRYQNLAKKTIQAINNNKIPAAKKFFEQFREEMKDVSPEFYDETSNIDLSDLTPDKEQTT